MDININNTAKWESKNLPINTYFIVEDERHLNKIYLKTYRNEYVNILNGKETFDNHTNFKECVIINKLKISIEQL